MTDISDQNNDVAKCLLKESEFFKSLERFEKANQPDATLDFVLKILDFSNSFCNLSHFQKNQIIYCNCIAIGVSACIFNA